MMDMEQNTGHAAPRMPTLLVVDDERSLVELLRNYLEAEGFTVLAAYDGPSALEKARAAQPDLVVLDVMIPGFDGIEVCRQLRRFSDAYVLMLTSKSQEVDKLIGLSVGADDYLTKPFSPRELVARVKAMLRRPRTLSAQRTEPDVPPPLAVGDLVIDMARHEVLRHGEPIHLTPREFDLLAIMAAHPGMVFTRNQLLRRIWGDEYFDTRVVDVHIASLRKKIEADPAQPRYIETVRGVGYRCGGRRAEPPYQEWQG
jgi:DNA-binding response OmpR family regulator